MSISPVAKPIISFDFSFDEREIFTGGLCYHLADKLVERLGGTPAVIVLTAYYSKRKRTAKHDIHGMCKVGDTYIDIEGVWHKEDAERFWWQYDNDCLGEAISETPAGVSFMKQTDGAAFTNTYEIVEKPFVYEPAHKTEESWILEYAEKIVRKMKGIDIVSL